MVRTSDLASMQKVASSILARGTKIFVAPNEHGLIKNLKKNLLLVLGGFRWFQVILGCSFF